MINGLLPNNHRLAPAGESIQTGTNVSLKEAYFHFLMYVNVQVRRL